jgi:hypothetical protein
VVDTFVTIHGLTREFALDVVYAGRTQHSWWNERMGFAAGASLDRQKTHGSAA